MTSEYETLILNSILNSLQSVVYLYNLNNATVKFLNKGIGVILGYNNLENKEISLGEYLKIFHEDDIEKFKSHLNSVLTGREKKYISIEYRLRSKRGVYKWFNDSIFNLIPGSLNNSELIGYAVDVSLSRKKEEKYLREEIRLKTILENTIEYYFFLESDYKIQSLNKNAKDFLNSKFERTIFEGYSILDSLPFENVEEFKNNFNYALTGLTFQHESKLTVENNQTKWYQFRYLPIRDKKERITGVCFIFTDVSEIRKSNESLIELNKNLEDRVNERTKELKEEVAQRKLTEDKLRVSLEKEKELNELKSKFIAMVSHEFKTPMTAISMSTQILENYGDEYTKANKEKHYKRINEATLSLNKLMENVLSISRAEASNIPFNPEKINLEKFLVNVISKFESMHPETIIELIIPDSNENEYLIDPNLITHILENLLNNAIKYSLNQRAIQVKVAFLDKWIEFIVKDSGIGIPSEDQSKIFETFFRGKNVGNISGTGLGLNLVKNFVAVHDGRIHFKSSEEFGTEFYVLIPKLQDK